VEYQVRIRNLLLAGLLSMLAMLTPVPAQGLSLPPIMQYGYLGYDFSMTQSKTASSQTHSAMANWNISSYIKQPYIAQYTGGLTLRYSLANTTANKGDKRYTIFGNLSLRLFPMSKFPFQMYYQEENSQTDRDESDLTTSRRIYGLIQRYTSSRNITALFQVEQSEQTFDDRVAERDQFGRSSMVNLDFTMPRGAWGLEWRNQFRKDENSRSNVNNERWFSVLRHHWRPGFNFSMNGFTSYRDSTRSRLEGFSTRDRRAEFNNYLNWRPDTKRPLFVNSTFRHTESLGGGGESGGGGTTTLTGSMNYMFVDRFNLIANATGSVLRIDGDEDFRTSALAEGRYQSFTHRWGTFSYQWNTALGTRWEDQSDEFGRVLTGVARFGHNLDKLFFPGPHPLTVRFSQFLSALEGTDGQSTQNLTQSLSLGWNYNTTRRSSVLSVNLSDNRSRGGGGRAGDQNRDLQLATLLFAQTENLSRQSRLVGSVSLQARRQSFSIDANPTLVPSGNADISYFNQMLFRVPFLRYRSTLRWYSSNFNTSLDDPTQSAGTKGLFWENRLDYTLGRLDLRLFLRFSSVNDINRNLIFLSVRRSFGGLLN